MYSKEKEALQERLEAQEKEARRGQEELAKEREELNRTLEQEKVIKK